MNTYILRITKSGRSNNIFLIHGDALEELCKLPEGSVDCVCTDPPYGSGGIATCQRKADPKAKYAAKSTAFQAGRLFLGVDLWAGMW